MITVCEKKKNDRDIKTGVRQKLPLTLSSLVASPTQIFSLPESNGSCLNETRSMREFMKCFESGGLRVVTHLTSPMYRSFPTWTLVLDLSDVSGTNWRHDVEEELKTDKILIVVLIKRRTWFTFLYVYNPE